MARTRSSPVGNETRQPGVTWGACHGSIDATQVIKSLIHAYTGLPVKILGLQTPI